MKCNCWYIALVLGFCQAGCKNAPTDLEEISAAEPIVPAIEVVLHGNAVETYDPDSLPLVMQTFQLRPPFWRLDTLQIVSDGRLCFKHPYPGLAMANGLGISSGFVTEVILDKGVEVHLNLDILLNDGESSNENGVWFSGPDSSANTVNRAFHQFVHPLKDSFLNRKDKLNAAQQYPRKVRMMMVDETFAFLDKATDAFCRDEECDGSEELLRNMHHLEKSAIILKLHLDSGLRVEILDGIRNIDVPILNMNTVKFASFYALVFEKSIQPELEFQLADLLRKIDGMDSEDSMFVHLCDRRAIGKDTNPDSLNRLYSKLRGKYRDELAFAFNERFFESLQAVPIQTAGIVKLLVSRGNRPARYTYLQRVLPTLSPFFADIAEDECAKLKLEVKSINKFVAERSTTKLDTKLGEPFNQLAFGADLYIANQDSFSHLVDAIRQHYHGKALILDIWAPWCAPCRKDIEASRPVKKLISDKALPVEIVYICNNNHSSEKNWQEAITQMQATGLHFSINGNLSQQLQQHFELTHYPTYVLIDQSGEYDFSFVNRIASIDIAKLAIRLGN